MINHIVLLCSAYGLVPFTDENVHRSALLLKIGTLQQIRDNWSDPLEFDLSLPALTRVGFDDIRALREEKTTNDFRKALSEFCTFVQGQPFNSNMWQWMSGKLQEIRYHLHEIKEVLRDFAEENESREVKLTKIPMKITMYVGTPLITRPFMQSSNGLSIFLDIRKLILDGSALKSAYQISKDTVEGAPKHIRKGDAKVEDLMAALRLRSEQ